MFACDGISSGTSNFECVAELRRGKDGWLMEMKKVLERITTPDENDDKTVKTFLPNKSFTDV